MHVTTTHLVTSHPTAVDGRLTAEHITPEPQWLRLEALASNLGVSPTAVSDAIAALSIPTRDIEGFTFVHRDHHAAIAQGVAA